jgi:hypothetical protein
MNLVFFSLLLEKVQPILVSVYRRLPYAGFVVDLNLQLQ